MTGPPQALGSTTAITIPESVLSVEGAVSDVEVEVDISKYLPREIKVVGSSVISVVLGVEALSHRSLTLEMEDIELKGRRLGDLYSMIPEQITVVVSGTFDGGNMPTAKDLQGSVDVAAWTTGRHSASLTFHPPQGVRVDSYTPFEVEVIHGVIATPSTQEESP